MPFELETLKRSETNPPSKIEDRRSNSKQTNNMNKFSLSIAICIAYICSFRCSSINLRRCLKVRKQSETLSH
jgi:hypothetical protein